MSGTTFPVWWPGWAPWASSPGMAAVVVEAVVVEAVVVEGPPPPLAGGGRGEGSRRHQVEFGMCASFVPRAGTTPPPNPLVQGEGENPNPNPAPAIAYPDGWGTYPGRDDARLQSL